MTMQRSARFQTGTPSVTRSVIRSPPCTVLAQPARRPMPRLTGQRSTGGRGGNGTGVRTHPREAKKSRGHINPQPGERRHQGEIPPKGGSVKGPAAQFTGDVWLDPIAQGAEPSRLRVNLVHFTPGARTAWHSHP